MSLINDMLKDLEARRVPPGTAAGTILGGVRYAGVSRSRRAQLWVLLAVIGAVGVAAGATAVKLMPSVQSAVHTTEEKSPEPKAADVEIADRSRAVAQPIQEAPKPSSETVLVSIGKHEPEPMQKPAPVAPPVSPRKPESKPATAVMDPLPKPEKIETAASAVEVKPSPRDSASSMSVRKSSVPEQSAAEKAEAHLLSGERLLRLSKFYAAEKEFRSALGLMPTLPEPRERLAGLLLGSGRVTEAESLLRSGLESQPLNESFVRLLARAVAAQNRIPEAIAILQPAVDIGESGLETRQLMAALYQQTQQFGKSQTIYERLLRNDPVNADWWLGFAISVDGQNRAADAAEAYRRALDLGGLKPASHQYAEQRLAVLNQQRVTR